MAKGAFGAQVELKGAGSGAGTPSTGITGLTSRQVLFGSPSGGIAQDIFLQYDSSNGRLGIGTTAPTARFSAIPSNAGEPTYDWYTSAGAHSGLINSSGHIGIGTTAPVAELHLASSTIATQIRFQNSLGSSHAIVLTSNRMEFYVASLAAAQARLVLGASGDVGIGIGSTGSPARLCVQTTANGNAFLVRATTAGTQPAFCIESTDSTSKIGFWTTAGSTRQPAYATTGTTSRTMNSTITPAAVYSSDVGAQVNALQGVVKSLIQDLVAYGLSPTTV